jgi:hypothetical protein
MSPALASCGAGTRGLTIENELGGFRTNRHRLKGSYES